MWYLLLYLGTLYGWRAVNHILRDPDHFSPYFHDKYLAHLWLVRVHGVFGSLDLMLGPWLLNSRVRLAWPGLHRLVCMFYFVALVPAALSGLALSSIAYGGPRLNPRSVCSHWGYAGWRACKQFAEGTWRAIGVGCCSTTPSPWPADSLRL